MKNVVLRKNNTRFFEGKLDWKSEIGDKIILVFFKENYTKKFNSAQKDSGVMQGRLQQKMQICAKITQYFSKED